MDNPEKISGRHIRSFLGEMAERGCADSYMHMYARVVKTFSRFMQEEGYINKPIRFPMPKLTEKHLLVYDANHIRHILTACQDKRDFAFILLMGDTGLRNAEVRNLTWGDVDIISGMIRIIRGKGKLGNAII